MSVTKVHDLAEYDVVVAGGGAAGLSGALTLGRVRRSVLVVDAGEPRNAPASGVHGFLTRDGTAPAELLRAGREEVRRYGVRVIEGHVESASRLDGGGFAVGLEDRRRVGARRLLVTTGLVDELPDVPGLRERWGRDVLHCPYCHGWEVRDQAIGVLASGPMSVHQALLFRQLSADVKFFSHTMPPPTDEQVERLAARGIGVVDGEVASLEVVEDRLVGVRLGHGRVVEREALAVSPRMRARCEFLAGLGCKRWKTPRDSVSTSRPTRPAVPTCPGCGSRATPPIWPPMSVPPRRRALPRLPRSTPTLSPRTPNARWAATAPGVKPRLPVA